MSSIIDSYNYDIFISYRQKDNKGNRWVSEFVDALKTELESTFKEDISIYFDENPHDGLLETHDVDASLKEKLKCLIFIPVISRTYCDTRAFAWQHEFLAFIELASADSFGLKVTLPTGNVATRILPVKIHELGTEDTILCESALGGVLRGVDFIYKAPGVNRPLIHDEDHPKDNLNKTYYRDQINKVANAIDEILQGLRNPIKEGKGKLTKKHESLKKENKQTSKSFKKPGSLLKWIVLTGLLIIILVFTSILTFRLLNSTFEKRTIGVLAFTNPNNDNVLSNIAIGYFDQIITMLNKVKGVNVNQRYLTLQYLNQTPPLNKLRREFKFNYLVEMSISGSPGNLKMWIGLAKTRGKKQIWAEDYIVDEQNLVSLFTGIVQNIAIKLDVPFSNDDIKESKKDLTNNPDAYISYLAGNANLFTAMGNKSVDSTDFVSAIKMYDKAISDDPGFAIAYARRSIARSWGYYSGLLGSSHIEKCWSDIVEATRLNKDLPDLQIACGFYYYYCTKDYYNALINFHTASLMDPSDYQPVFYKALVYRKIGDWNKSMQLIHKVIKLNPQEPLFLTNIGLSYTYAHKFDSAIIYHQRAIEASPDWLSPYLNKIQSLILLEGSTSKAWAVLDSAARNAIGSVKEYSIILNIYDGKYEVALAEAESSDSSDFDLTGIRYLILANIHTLLKNNQAAEKYYDSALVSIMIDNSADSTIASVHSLLGIAYAGKGNVEKAISEIKKAVSITISGKDKIQERDMLVTMAQIYTMTGHYDDALKTIEDLLENPSCFSIRLMEIDPEFKQLLYRPEFRTLKEKYLQNI